MLVYISFTSLRAINMASGRRPEHKSPPELVSFFRELLLILNRSILFPVSVVCRGCQKLEVTVALGCAGAAYSVQMGSCNVCNCLITEKTGADRLLS